MKRLAAACLAVLLAGPAYAFDASEYRQNTYGAPNHYCDPTLSNAAPSGSGTLGDPWNLLRCQTEPVAGDVVGLLPGVGTISATDSDQVIAFQPTHSGTVNNRIVYVTKYAAVALGSTPADVAANANRTEIRHDGTAETNAQGSGTGGPLYGSSIGYDYITYDGLFTDMAYAHIHEDSGVIRVERATGIHFKNFVVKGTAEQVWSNAMVYRANGATDTVLSNFMVHDFTNTSDFGQGSAFCASYGDENFIMEHFDIKNVGKGIYLKGPYPTTPGTETHWNNGIIRYGKVYDGTAGFRFGSADPTTYVDVHHVLTYGNTDTGMVFSNEVAGVRRHVRVDHATIIGGASGLNQLGSVYLKSDTGTGNEIMNSIIDVRSGAGYNLFTEETSASYATDFTSNYNGFSRNSADLANYVNTADQTTIAAWRTASSNDANSAFYNVTSSDIFNNRGSNDYTIATGHAALTADSTGGQLGAYEGGHVIGVDTTAASTGSTGGAVISGGVRFTGSVRIQ